MRQDLKQVYKLPLLPGFAMSYSIKLVKITTVKPGSKGNFNF